ncbi:MAG: zinc ribbon domain-containing protein [candidate division Zixibacteria bacterium]|nr:zinc ribbon domain-containing protein [candidate division Zixibacteria bacterium]
MPIYEYSCQRCGAKFDILQRASTSQAPACPKCRSNQVKKLLSVFAFSSGGEFVSSSSKGTSCSTCSSRDCSGCR